MTCLFTWWPPVQEEVGSPETVQPRLGVRLHACFRRSSFRHAVFHLRAPRARVCARRRSGERIGWLRESLAEPAVCALVGLLVLRARAGWRLRDLELGTVR